MSDSVESRRVDLLWNTTKEGGEDRSSSGSGSGSGSGNGLNERLSERKDNVRCDVAGVHNSATNYHHSTWSSSGIDGSFSLKNFKDNLQIDVRYQDQDELVFDLIGVDPPIANALRRILIAEVPTVAIEKVDIHNNTSILQDEVLAHRLGLVPIDIDPELMKAKKEDEPATDENTITFELNITCRRMAEADRKKAGLEGDDMGDGYVNSKVFSRDLVWKPTGDQLERFPMGVRPVHEDILLAKMRPGQAIHVVCHCEMGLGETHAKWSPVATASYRLLPDVVLYGEDIVDEEAEVLKAMCPTKVFDIEDLGGGKKKAVVANPRACTVCRECIRRPDYQDKIKLLRKKDHFIFSIESVGMIPPTELFRRALRILIKKCDTLTHLLDELEHPTAPATNTSNDSADAEMEDA
eukprot:TRINITY_DN241_c0_g1_i1.p1 TRINITY_DN241_c0_g1~~TRINITY_DN241_c0_g1_i1.p1  ORF type:complete len:451 (-),score=112.19 TRINITY_DN241_c0_g1_i1:70-1296(-)